MAQIDANIPLSVQPFQAPDPLKAAEKVYTLKSMQEQMALLPMQRQQMMQQLQHGALQNQGLQEGLDEKTALRSAYTYKQDGNIDYESTAKKLAEAGKPNLIPALNADRRKTETEASDQAAKASAASKASAEAKNAWVEHIVSPAMSFYQSEYDKAGDGPGSDIKKQAILKQAHDHYHQIVQQSNGVLPDVPGELKPEGLKQLANVSQEAYKKRLEAGQPTDFQKNLTAANQPGADPRLAAKVEHDTTYPPQLTIMSTPSGALASVEAKSGQPPKATVIPGTKGFSKPGVGGAGEDFTPEQKKFWGDVMIQGGQLPPGLARSESGRRLVQDLMKEVPAGTTAHDMLVKQAELMGLKAGERTLGTRQAQVDMAVTEAQKLSPLVLEASDKVDRTKYPKLNSILMAAEKGTGDENVVRLGIAINSMINVYARAISPSGTPTVSDKDHARELLSSAWSKGQIKAAMEQLNKEMAAAKASPAQVREDMGGRTKEPAPAESNKPRKPLSSFGQP